MATIPWSDRFLLLEAALRLLAARMSVALLPFRVVSRRLGDPARESPRDEPPAIARRIRWAIAAISRRAPWRCQCLEQAIAAKMMLRARRVPNTLYLGVAQGEAKAHAWLRSGSFFVTGGDGSHRFAILSSFSDE
jgi:Transglutaminase-like superfamily